MVLNNGLSHNYSDNPKAVAEFLCRSYPGCFEIFFAVRDVEKHRFLREKGIQPVRFRSLRYFYCAMTAAVYLTNNGGYSYFPLRKGRLVIDTWHGGGAYKKCGLWGYKYPKIGRAEMKLAASNLDLFLSTSVYTSEVFAESFLIPRRLFWEIGMPRNDSLLHPDAILRKEVRERLGLSEGERLALFAPTFRRLGGVCTEEPAAVSYGMDRACLCGALERRFGGTWRLAFRFHPEIKRREESPMLGVLDVSGYDDMQELLCAADVLVTDFSSSMWDFMLTGRPCFLFALDFERYLQTTEVYTPVSEWPFPKASSLEELEQSILNFHEKDYKEACVRHYRELGGCETGRAARLVGERIYEHVFSCGAGTEENPRIQGQRRARKNVTGKRAELWLQREK